MNMCTQDILGQDQWQRICINAQVGVSFEESGRSQEADMWADVGREAAADSPGLPGPGTIGPCSLLLGLEVLLSEIRSH